MIIATWSAIFLAALAGFWFQARRLGLVLLLAGYSSALWSGLLAPAALPWLLLLLLAGWAARQQQRPWQYGGHALFIALALALSLHWLPGFHNLRVIDAVHFTPEAAPFTLYLNLDKPLAGFWLILCLPWLGERYCLRRTLGVAARYGLLTSAVCMGMAWSFGLLGWAPKMPAQTWLWLLNNLLLVSLAEEALFRGYLQGGLRRLLASRQYAEVWAIGSAATLFGLAHAAAGWRMALVAGVAGVGYGLAYRRGGLRAAVLTHVALNTVHFLCFTYPQWQIPR
jgi:membrane protease YdiL (CAAX protease family)